MSIILVACFSATYFFSSTSFERNTTNRPQIHSEETVSRSKLEGTWDYTVKDVPPEYSTGVIRIMKNQKVFEVEVDLSGGTMKGSEVMARRKNISFYLTINGQRVDVALQVDGDTITGESTSPDGVFKLEGVRRKV